MFVVVLIGASLGAHFDLAGLGVGLFLILFLRPISALAFLARAPLPRDERPLVAWFGLRGIGSLY